MNRRDSYLLAFVGVALGVAEQQIPAIREIEEKITPLTYPGADKKTEAVNIVLNSPILKGMIPKAVYDEPLFKQGVAEANDAFVKILNAIKAHTPNK